MSSTDPNSALRAGFVRARRAVVGTAVGIGRWVRRIADPRVLGASAVALGLTMAFAIAPPPPASEADALAEFVAAHAQTLDPSDLPTDTEATLVIRDDYTATPGVETLKAEGTNYAWAKMVLLFAGLPMTDDNVTVFTRWMRQENGPDDWFNRNNPLNNGWGSGGGGGTGRYVNLVDAAQNAAEAMLTLPGYQGFVDAFRRSAPTTEIESAIWASSWATGHYANGAHWHYTPVPVVPAPAGAWG